jgi:hypothetical protein
MNRELLEKPFDPTQIKQRRGRDGMLDYVEGHAVIARLNEAFEGQWSFEIVRHDILEERDEILVLGKLSAEGVVKMQFGVAQITRDRETKEIVSLGDDVKAAGTDALKKCATFLGVGLHLYGARSRSRSTQGVPGQGGDRGRGAGGTGRRERPAKGGTSPPPPTPSGNGQERAAQSPAPENRGGVDGPPVPSAQQTGQTASGQATPQASLPAAQPPAPRQAGNGRLDNAQHTAILALAKKRKLSRLELDLEALKRYGVQIPYLTYADAAHFIQELQSMR